MSKVYVVHKQMKWDKVKKRGVPVFDLAPAEEYGELVYLLPPEASPHRPEETIDLLTESIRDFDCHDYLLLVGNPCFIGWAAAKAADLTDGHLQLLQWDRQQQRYAVVKCQVWPDNEDQA